jgi:probable phosphoglycerate mutase
MRHAQPDWALVADGKWRGAANDLVPLNALGKEQAAQAAERLRSRTPALVLSPPMTRARQTAAIVAGALSVRLEVDLDLREWLPDESYQWTSVSEVVAAYDDMVVHDGVHPHDGRRWEPLGDVRQRALRALAPYLSAERPVLVVCHEVLIHALTGQEQTGHAQVRVLDPSRTL